MGLNATPVIKPESELGSPWRRLTSRDMQAKKQHETLTRHWQASMAREGALRKENRDILDSQLARSAECEHRLFNGLQLIVGILLLQCRTAAPAAAEQLNTAAARISAFARVHRRLHLIDYDGKVEIKQHLQGLCIELAGVLSAVHFQQSIVVESPNCELPVTVAVPISLIVNELITNSMKHAKSNITVRFESITPISHSISVVDEGPGLPGGFNPAKSRGLGMQIVRALVKEVGGELRFLNGPNGCGTTATLIFFLPDLEKSESVVSSN